MSKLIWANSGLMLWIIKAARLFSVYTLLQFLENTVLV